MIEKITEICQMQYETTNPNGFIDSSNSDKLSDLNVHIDIKTNAQHLPEQRCENSILRIRSPKLSEQTEYLKHIFEAQRRFGE